MDVVAVCRVAAQIAVAIVVQRCIAHQRQFIVPSAIAGHDIEEVPPLAAQVESATVALGVFVLELIGKLQVGLRQDRLAVGGFHIVVPVFGRRHGIAVGLIGIARRHLVVVHRVVGKRATHAFAVVGIEVHHDVAPPTVQFPVDLQIAGNGLGVAVADAVAEVAVLHQSGGHQFIHLTGLQRVGNALLGVGVSTERSTASHRQAVVAVVSPLRTEHHVPKGVGLPLQSQSAIPAVRTVIALTDVVAEGRCRRTHEVLRRFVYQIVFVPMVPADASVQLQAVFLLVVEVQARHLRSRQTLTSGAPAPATVGIGHVADVVAVAHEHHLQVVLHPSAEQSATVAVVRTYAYIGIEHKALVHTFLNAEVEHRLFLTIIDTADTCLVALHVVGLHTLYNIGGQVLQRCLGIACHKLLAIDHNLLHLLAIDGNLAVIVNLGTRQSFHQLLQHSTLRRSVGRSIIDKGVGLDNDLRRLTGHHGIVQHHGIGLHDHGAHVEVLVAA